MMMIPERMSYFKHMHIKTKLSLRWGACWKHPSCQSGCATSTAPTAFCSVRTARCSLIGGWSISSISTFTMDNPRRATLQCSPQVHPLSYLTFHLILKVNVNCIFSWLSCISDTHSHHWEAENNDIQGDPEKKFPSVEMTIRTKWEGAVIDWNGTVPFF